MSRVAEIGDPVLPEEHQSPLQIRFERNRAACMLTAVTVDRVLCAAVQSLEPADDVPRQDRAVRIGVSEAFQLFSGHADEYDSEVDLGWHDSQVGFEAGIVAVPLRIQPALRREDGFDRFNAVFGVQISAHGQDGPGEVHGQLAGCFRTGLFLHGESGVRQLFFQIGDQFRIRDKSNVAVASAFIGLQDAAEIIPVDRLRNDAAENKPPVVHLQGDFRKLLQKTAHLLIRLKRRVVHRDMKTLLDASGMDRDDGTAGRNSGHLERVAADMLDLDVGRIRFAGFDGKRHAQCAFFPDGDGDLFLHRIVPVFVLRTERLGDRLHDIRLRHLSFVGLRLSRGAGRLLSRLAHAGKGQEDACQQKECCRNSFHALPPFISWSLLFRS